MKKTALVVLTFAALSSLFAQQKGSAQLSKASIDINGAELRLGMTKGEVTDKLAGNAITKENDDAWMIAPSGKFGPFLQFTNGRLTFADRNWVTYDNDIAEALFGAVNTLNEEGLSACIVTTDVKTDPTVTLHRVWIKCAEKSILVVRSVFREKSFNTVYEQLGNMR